MNEKNDFYFKTVVTLNDFPNDKPIYYDACILCKKKIKKLEGKYFCEKNCGLFF